MAGEYSCSYDILDENDVVQHTQALTFVLVDSYICSHDLTTPTLDPVYTLYSDQDKVISLAGALNGNCIFHFTMEDDDTWNLLDDSMLTLTDVVLAE